ncbi:MAG: pyridoxamine 5'-phosphate oxidase [Phycisphaerales bacterium]
MHAADPGPLAGALGGACVFKGTTLPDPLPVEPMALFSSWLADAARARISPNPNAMALATVDARGHPSARIVLCRGVDTERGFIVFYTNYESDKARELAAIGRASALFHWDGLERQVRISGPAVRSPESESEAYFNARPKESRIAAWASAQSRPLASRDELLSAQAEMERRFGVRAGVDPESDPAVVVPRPPHWGGFRIFAERVELWLGHSHRLHDRARYERDLTPASIDRAPGFTGGPWRSGRLQP